MPYGVWWAACGTDIAYAWGAGRRRGGKKLLPPGVGPLFAYTPDTLAAHAPDRLSAFAPDTPSA
eukprot:2705506-Rhodomonas_salina.4